MKIYKTPGVYVEEISTLPPSVAEVSTAIPAFLGYTETGGPAITRITSMVDYVATFGGAKPTTFNVTTVTDPATSLPSVTGVVASAAPVPDRLMFYAVSHYFANGGGPCYIVSLGPYTQTVAANDFLTALDNLALEDEPTLIVLTDAVLLQSADYFSVAQKALAQCDTLQDRFTILDVPGGDVAGFRGGIGINNLFYGAAYHPYIRTTLTAVIDETTVQLTNASAAATPTTWQATFPGGNANGLVITRTASDNGSPKVVISAGDGGTAAAFTITAGQPTLTINNAATKTAKEIGDQWVTFKAANASQLQGFDMAIAGDGSAVMQATATPGGADLPKTGGGGGPAVQALASIRQSDTARYNAVKAALANQRVTLPPSATIAGVYASVDRDRGVWKAPANVSLSAIIAADRKMTDADQEGLNVDPTAGKSINAIRDFTGKGTLVWGARTLAGNDNEWRYVPVRRLFITVEENTRKASAFAVFEPNDATTWLKVRGTIESYLYSLWERGALAGPTPDAAYYVHVGLGKTMTQQDVLEGRMIVEIGIAAVRPAEFIVLRFMHKLQQA